VLDVGAGDKCFMFGYASDEAADCVPITHSMATRLGKVLIEVRKTGELIVCDLMADTGYHSARAEG
jgi:S-adenosylmethionine synthetase